MMPEVRIERTSFKEAAECYAAVVEGSVRRVDDSVCLDIYKDYTFKDPPFDAQWAVYTQRKKVVGVDLTAYWDSARRPVFGKD